MHCVRWYLVDVPDHKRTEWTETQCVPNHGYRIIRALSIEQQQIIGAEIVTVKRETSLIMAAPDRIEMSSSYPGETNPVQMDYILTLAF